MARRSLPLDQDEYDVLVDTLDLFPPATDRSLEKTLKGLRTKLASIKSQTFNLPEMSLRDYFAAQAMPALYAVSIMSSSEKIASKAYELADAMLEARGR